VVFPSLKRGRYFGFRLACYPQGEAEPVGFLGTARATDARSAEGSARYPQRAGATPTPRGAPGVVPPELAEPRRVVVPPSAAIPHRD
jgi:hypothetical protein